MHLAKYTYVHMYSLAIQAISEKFINACMYKMIVIAVVTLLTQNKIIS